MKIIGIDLDDILLNFNDAFVKFHNEKYGTSHTRKNVTDFHLENVWDISREEMLKRLDAFYTSDHHKNAQPIEGAIEAINKLAKENELHVITASPEDMKKEIIAWLGTHFQGKFKNVHFVNKSIFGTSMKNKSEVCKELGIEVFVDDALHNAEDIAQLGVPVFLLDTPWNQGEVKPPIARVHSWDEIMQRLAE